MVWECLLHLAFWALGLRAVIRSDMEGEFHFSEAPHKSAFLQLLWGYGLSSAMLWTFRRGLLECSEFQRVRFCYPIWTA